MVTEVRVGWRSVLFIASVFFFIAALISIILLGWNIELFSKLLNGLQVPVALVATGIAFMTPLLTQNTEPTGLPLSKRTVRLVAGGLVLVVFATAALVFGHRQYRDFDVEFGSPVDTSPGMMAEMSAKVRGSAPFGGELVFSVNMIRISELGDCVLPATLTVSVLADHFAADQVELRSGEQGVLVVPQNSRRVSMKVLYNNKIGEECRVRVSLTDGKLVR